MTTKLRKHQYLCAVLVSVCTVTMGMSSAWPTPVIPKLLANETSFSITKDEIAWMLALSSPGFIAGSFTAAATADRLGRRATLLWSAAPYGSGMLLLVVGRVSWLLYASSVLRSWGTGMISNVLPFYFAEISDADIRATLLLTTRTAFNLGALLVMCLGPFLTYDTLNCVLSAFPLGYLVACSWLPESPYWYLKEGRVDDARKVLVTLRGAKEQDVEAEMCALRGSVRRELVRAGGLRELLTGVRYRRALFIAAGLKLTSIMSGTLTVQQYLGLIMQPSQDLISLPTVIIIFGAVRFVVSMVPTVLADRWGRRPLLMTSFASTALALAAVAGYFLLLDVLRLNPATITPYGPLAFAAIVCSNVLATVGYNSVVTVIPGELFPMNVKAVAMTCVSVLGGALSAAVAGGYRWLEGGAGGHSAVFALFATAAAAGALFTLLMVPETKGRSLQDIQLQLQGRHYCSGYHQEGLGERGDTGHTKLKD